MIHIKPNFFTFVMEADGDLEAFDPGEDMGDAGAGNNQQQPVESSPSSGTADTELGDVGAETNTTSSGDLEGFNPGDDDMDGGNTDDTDYDNTEPDNSNNEKMSEKANNILNQKLYETMVTRNRDIETIIENIQKLAPVLPIEIINANDVHVNRLKKVLESSKDYVLHKFIDMEYGENLTYYQKVDSLYTILLESIDSNLKKIDNK